MTHEELLAKFTDYEAHFDQVRDEPKVFAMLRAVVELHKPFFNKFAQDYTCDGCGYAHYPLGSSYSPRLWKDCPTIQAIEKELK